MRAASCAPSLHGIFTDPEIGSVGMAEAAGRTAGYDVAVGLVKFDKIEKAELIGTELRLIKYVVGRGSRRCSAASGEDLDRRGASHVITCPACGADFDGRERLEEQCDMSADAPPRRARAVEDRIGFSS